MEQLLSPTYRKIIHVDMDAFYASVEQRDRPSYRGKPIVVGGTPEQRGAVAAASYEARRFGVHSAMPSRVAVRRCPDLIFVKPRFEVYRAVSEQIRAIFHNYTDLVEPLALDEAYLDVTENKAGLPSATWVAQAIKAEIYQETQLTASAGVSINKFLAKIASGMDKPNGLYLIPPEQAEDFIAQLPIDRFHGVGTVTASKMHQLGIFTGADLRQWSELDLQHHFGKVGCFFYRIARGQDERLVNANRIRKSIGVETSFKVDLDDRPAVVAALGQLAPVLKDRMDRRQCYGRTLTVKLKYADYQQITRSRTMAYWVQDVETILAVALELLAAIELEGRRVRLLGLSTSGFPDAQVEQYEQLVLDLFASD
ncbi:DNA polymerase IV [Egbenema bharatensis]|uniref:DNA polymerase IV n=1 Tax=Egbenema bharatensis TaxID=3463334 RepID=UPI003A8A0B41